MLTLATGALRRLTVDDGLEQLDGWSRDGRWIYFSSTSHDIAGMNDIFRVPSTAARRWPVSEDRYVNEFGAAPSPDGKSLAFVARGIASNQWWRKGSSHSTSPSCGCSISPSAGCLHRDHADATRGRSWPMWSGDGTHAVLRVRSRRRRRTSGRGRPPPTGRDRQVTTFRDGRVLWPSITDRRQDDRVRARLRHLDARHRRAARRARCRSRVAARRPTPAPERDAADESASRIWRSRPTAGRWRSSRAATCSRRRPRTAATRRASPRTPELESQPVWAPDSRRLAYVSARGDGPADLSLRLRRRRRKRRSRRARRPICRRCSRRTASALAFLRNRKELRVIDLDTKQDRVLATGHVRRHARHAEARLVAGRHSGSRSSPSAPRRSPTSSSSRSTAASPRPVSFLANVVREHDRVEPRRHVPALRHEPAHRAGPARARRPDAAHAEVPRGSVPGSVHAPADRPRPVDPAAVEPSEPREPDEPAEPLANPDPVFDDIRRACRSLPVSARRRRA